MTTDARSAAERLAADPANAALVAALIDGRALTARELARTVRIDAAAANAHLHRMSSAGFVEVARQGPHRYYRLASRNVRKRLETVLRIGSQPIDIVKRVTGPADARLRFARTCYGHLAGRLGVAITDTLVGRGFLRLSDNDARMTKTGRIFFLQLGLDPAILRPGRARALCRPCLDWSERRLHLGGALASAFCALSLRKGWLRRLDGKRALALTAAGRRVYEGLGVRVD